MNRGAVDDWIAFFRQDWTAAIYRDNFGSLVSTLRQALESDKGMFYVLDKITDSAKEEPEDAAIASLRKQVVGLRGEYTPVLTRKAVETHTLAYLRHSRARFSDFHIPKK